MNKDTEQQKQELIRLVQYSEGAVGIDLKRTNYKIAELRNRIDFAERR